MNILHVFEYIPILYVKHIHPTYGISSRIHNTGISTHVYYMCITDTACICRRAYLETGK